MSLPTILGLDLASRTGFAVGYPGGKPVLGAVSLVPAGPSDGRQKGSNGPLGTALLDWLHDMQKVHGFTRVVYEAPLARGRHSGIQAGRIALGLAMVAEVFCERRDLQVFEVAVNTVRARTVGNGNASKPQVMAWCEAQGWNPPGHDAADAAAVWAFACLPGALRMAA